MPGGVDTDSMYDNVMKVHCLTGSHAGMIETCTKLNGMAANSMTIN